MAQSIADIYLHPLPSYLTAEQPPETPEVMALQVWLLTHEVANLRTRLNLLAEALMALGQGISLPAGDPTDATPPAS